MTKYQEIALEELAEAIHRLRSFVTKNPNAEIAVGLAIFIADVLVSAENAGLDDYRPKTETDGEA